MPDLATALTAWLPSQPWFPSAGCSPVRTEVLHIHPFAPLGDAPAEDVRGVVAVVRVHHAGARGAGVYQVPLGVRSSLPPGLRPPVVAERLGVVLYDALGDPELVDPLVRRISAGRSMPGLCPEQGLPGAELPARRLRSRPLGVEQSNTSVLVEDRYLLKVFRRLEPGTNPDLEVQLLLRAAGSRSVPRLLGALTGRLGRSRATFAVLQEYVADAEEGWQSALTDLRGTGDRAREDPPAPGGGFAASVLELGRAVARVHGELARAGGTVAVTESGTARLAAGMEARFEASLTEAPLLAPHAGAVRAAYAAVPGVPVRGLWPDQRVHGDLHLGQVLRTGDRWRIVDFEGEPNAPLNERRARQSVLKDVAGMLRSFDYAAHHGGAAPADEAVPADRPVAGGPPASDSTWGGARDAWAARHQDAFCAGYAAVAGRDPREFDVLLTAHLLDKAVYEVVYETRRRPEWAAIPLAAVARLAADITRSRSA
ncbi:maltokinase N-terminal cap-like domain-containing protein [Streptomyces sp. 8L]|uniref:maltokinase N-terminal cap-like domain-containing protein n=1 Tax=Streptomyces sp. 8L TaxID=2877242 RepID=UPI001CD724A8|nr:phosphotransferase [Streptomyces sp. 8L]MCA1216886.1 phosphotransferase [Streptomyces sp. 8L]